MKEKFYYVASGGDTPEQIFFNKEDAFESDITYIDVFDSKGIWIEGYKWSDGKYTTDF